MWMKNGSMLTGHYGKWKGKQVELRSCTPEDGFITMIHDGTQSPGDEWNRLSFPGRFARGPVRYYLEVPESEVKAKVIVDVVASMNRTKARVIAEDGSKLAVEVRDAPAWMKELRDQHGLEMHSEGYVYGWLPSLEVVSIVTQITKVP